MSVNSKLTFISKEINNTIYLLESSEPKIDITTKVQAILTEAETLPEDASVKKLLVQLENSLNSHDLKELGEKVHQITIPLLETPISQPIELDSTPFNQESVTQVLKTLDEAITSYENQDVFSFKGKAVLSTLQNLQDWESNPEIRRKIIQLKSILEEDNSHRIPRIVANLSNASSFLINAASRIFHPQEWATSKSRIQELFQKAPEKFGLTPDQMFETAKMIIEKEPEGVDFLVSHLDSFGLVRKLLIKNPNNLIKGDQLFKIEQIVANKDLKYLVSNIETLDIGVTKEWILQNVEESGASKERRFEISKRLAESYSEQLFKDALISLSGLNSTIDARVVPRFDPKLTISDFTSAQFLEIAKAIDSPSAGKLAPYASYFGLKEEELFTFAKLIMEEDPNGFDAIKNHIFESLRGYFREQTNLINKQERLELAVIGILNHYEIKDSMLYVCPELSGEEFPEFRLFSDTEKCIKKGAWFKIG